MIYVWLQLVAIGATFFLIGFIRQWWTVDEIDSYGYKSWQRIVTGRGTWSWETFFGSLSGLAIIAWEVTTFIVSMYYVNRYNKKTGK